ncbi:hypothetical protein PGTUg99_007495 [Puccinia graminis f. sp. tritici]|uniref:Uncharacterized protein n=1 Tax=Puccinia graminis f. sp. tritici TaxID=56615 RepID=A0A5B0MPG2_PUCGR|nr:hypothetical protein PGTUg99_007495 [Puccinia graminis f. sp. tritici]
MPRARQRSSPASNVPPSDPSSDRSMPRSSPMSSPACNHASIASAKLFVSTPSPTVCRAVYRCNLPTSPYLIEAKIPQRPRRLVTVPPPAPPSSTPLDSSSFSSDNAIALWSCHQLSSSDGEIRIRQTPFFSPPFVRQAQQHDASLFGRSSSFLEAPPLDP